MCGCASVCLFSECIWHNNNSDSSSSNNITKFTAVKYDFFLCTAHSTVFQPNRVLLICFYFHFLLDFQANLKSRIQLRRALVCACVCVLYLCCCSHYKFNSDKFTMNTSWEERKLVSKSVLHTQIHTHMRVWVADKKPTQTQADREWRVKIKSTKSFYGTLKWRAHLTSSFITLPAAASSFSSCAFD